MSVHSLGSFPVGSEASPGLGGSLPARAPGRGHEQGASCMGLVSGATGRGALRPTPKWCGRGPWAQSLNRVGRLCCTSLPRAVSLGQLLAAGKAGGPAPPEQGRGWGAVGHPGRALRSTGSRGLSMTPFNNKPLQVWTPSLGSYIEPQ